MEQSKHFAKEVASISQKLSKKYPIIDRYGHYNTLMEKIRILLFMTPIYMHTIHDPKKRAKKFQLFNVERETVGEDGLESVDSILLLFIRSYERKHNFNFEEKEVIDICNYPFLISVFSFSLTIQILHYNKLKW